MIRTNAIDKVIRNVLGSVAVSSEFPFFSKKSSSIVPVVLGAVGVAIASGIAAVMIFSPRTRTRALGIAKELPTKLHGIQDQIGHTAIGQKLGIKSQPNGLSNGLASEHGISDYGTTSGL